MPHVACGLLNQNHSSFPMNYCPIIGTLGYILSPDRQSVLLTHRIARKSDEQFGKYNGLGGHLEPNEDVATGMIREIREESTLEVTSMTLRGTVNWTGFGPHGEDWLGFIFLITDFTGTPLSTNEEGTLSWVPLKNFPIIPCGRATSTFCHWSLMTTRAPSTASCLTMVTDRSPGTSPGFNPESAE